MVDCLQCQGGDRAHSIDNVEYTANVKPGEHYTIVAYTSRKWYASSYQRLCLFNGSKNLSNSGSIQLGHDETIKTVFTGVMPDTDMYINLSLQSEHFGFDEICRDSKDFIIRASDVTTVIPSPEPPYTPPTESAPWIPPWEAAEDSMINTVVVVGVAAIAIALILKRK